MANIFDLFKKIEKGSATAGGAVTHLVVGLGNPGRQYENTRHNAGFLALDAIAAHCGATVDRAKFSGLVGEGSMAGKRVLFLKPQTFMNLSGEAVRAAAQFYHVPPENVIVIYDDVTLDVGRLRVRAKGSDGGHNGMKSIISCLGSNEFPRIRVGVGKKPHPDFDLAEYVMSSFSQKENEILNKAFETVERGTCLLIEGKVAEAQQLCNGAVVC